MCFPRFASMKKDGKLRTFIALRTEENRLQFTTHSLRQVYLCSQLKKPSTLCRLLSTYQVSCNQLPRYLNHYKYFLFSIHCVRRSYCFAVKRSTWFNLVRRKFYTCRGTDNILRTLNIGRSFKIYDRTRAVSVWQKPGNAHGRSPEFKPR